MKYFTFENSLSFKGNVILMIKAIIVGIAGGQRSRSQARILKFLAPHEWL